MSHDTTRPSFKTVILGNSGVGKTSLVTRWTTGSYHTSTNPTVGANHQRKRVVLGNEEVDMFLWDTAGQEQFKALTPLYARSSSVAILTVAITDTASFDNIDMWLELLNSSTEEMPPVVMAVNKIDLEDETTISRNKIWEDYHEKFAGIFYVSAMTDEGVDNMFNFVAQKGYEFMKSTIKIAPMPPPMEEQRCKC